MDFQDDELKEILNIFRAESEEIIERLNNTLLELEKSPTNKDLIVLLFRDAHSLKGASRMIGFSKTQNIAHKIEDILGLAKENQLKMNSQIADIIYKSVDLISKIISQSIESGKEIYLEKEVNTQINLLEEISANSTQKEEKNEEIPTNNEFNFDYFLKTIDRINYLVIDTLLNIVKLTEKIENDCIHKIYERTSELIEHFKKINYFDIKSELETINLKLEVIIKCNTELTYKEVEELQQRADTVITKLSNLCHNNDLPVVDYYAYAFSGKSYERGAEKFNQETANVQVVEEIPTVNLKEIKKNDFNELKKQMETLSNSTEYVSDLINEFKSLKELYENVEISPLLNKILGILNLIQKVSTPLEDSQLEVLMNCANYCFKFANKENPSENIELLIQQLNVVKQLIELSNPVDTTSLEVAKSEDDEIQKTHSEKISTKALKDFSKILNSGEIKTLHVESTKLDAMVNQLGELISTKIKTTKRFSKVSSVTRDLEEWQKDFSKILQHIRLYDKKNFKSDLKMDSSNVFVKQFIESMLEQNKKLTSIVADFNQLQRANLEDDMKMRVLIDDFGAMVKNIRILPLATVFHLFGRMVRDIAKESGKQVELKVTGSETSADKKIIEEIKNPLIHIIRNSIDHGIEVPERRVALGKDPVGHIQINAKLEDNHIQIEVIDDGQGFNIEKIKEKAVSKGFYTEKEIETMSEQEIFNIVFLAGFSTGDEVTNISGRGVGMDIVKSKIAQLNGTVNIVSEINKGTKIQINLPVTMATMSAFVIQTSSQTFAIPMSAINTIICKKKEELIQNQDKLSLLYNNKNVPLFNLSDILGLPQTSEISVLKTILILEIANQNVGIIVDKLLGEQEILHKNLEPPLHKIKNISGVTTLASGETCLVLNALDLMKNATHSPVIKMVKTPSIVDKNSFLKNKKILIVDDSLTIRTLEKNILMTANFYVETAKNPIEALKLMKYVQFDLIITDIEMPEINGIEFLSKLKSNETYAKIPVVVMSSLLDEKTKKECVSLGAENFIIKGDFKQNSFVDEISSILLKSLN